MLKIEGLIKNFDGLTAVNNVDLEVKEGSLTSLIGPNGSGKSTLFNLVSGIEKPDKGKGSILFDGHDLIKLRPHQIAKLGIGHVFQLKRLFDSLTVIENVIVGMHKDTKATFLDPLFFLPREQRERE